MPRYEKDGLVIETSVARESARLRQQGFKETKARTEAVKVTDAEKAPKLDADAGQPATQVTPKPTK